MIFNEKTPYLVTILIGALAWSVTHLVDRLNNTPLLKYDMIIEQSKNTRRLIISLDNITSNKVFRNLSIVTSMPLEGTITKINVIPTEPAFEGDNPYIISKNGRTAEIKLPVVQPGWLFNISIEYTGENRPRGRIDINNDSVMLTRPCLKTFLVENEFEVIVSFIILWLILLAIISWAVKK